MYFNGEKINLEQAITCGRLDLVETLLAENELEVDISDIGGLSSLMNAVCALSHSEVFELRIQGVKLPLPENLENNPQYCDGKMARYKIFELLLEHGDVNFKAFQGSTALHLAVRWGHLDAVKLLINKGADVNCRDIEGKTPLHWAAMCRRFNIAKILVKHNADSNAIDKTFGYSPLDYAILLNDESEACRFTQFLYFNDLDFNSTSKNLTVAHSRGFDKCFQLLKSMSLEKCAAFINENEFKCKMEINDDEMSYADWLTFSGTLEQVARCFPPANPELERFINERYSLEPLSYAYWLSPEVADEVGSLLLSVESEFTNYRRIVKAMPAEIELKKRKREEGEGLDGREGKRLKKSL